MRRYTWYRDMTNVEMDRLDLLMEQHYKALPSVVTDNTWVRTGPGVWCKAYCTLPANSAEPPILYMVHYSVDHKRHVVYRSLPLPLGEEQQCISAPPAAAP